MGLFGCRHKWYPVNVFHYSDTSFNIKPGVPSTCVTSRCTKCGTITEKNLYGVGYLNLNALQSVVMVPEQKKKRSVPNWLKVVK